MYGRNGSIGRVEIFRREHVSVQRIYPAGSQAVANSVKCGHLQIFRKWDLGVWTGSSWFRIGAGGGHL
jgi:hypothetical protein